MPFTEVDYSKFSSTGECPNLKDVDFLVECSRMEWSGIIEHYHDRWKSWHYKTGILKTVCNVDFMNEVMPICVDITFWEINGFLVACYEGCSTLVHHRIIEDFMRKSCPRVNWHSAHSDANNFHNIQLEIDRRLANIQSKKIQKPIDT